MEVLRGVLVLGGVATANVPAAQAQAKVHPPVAHLQTLFTTSGMRFDVLHLVEMCALAHLDCPFFYVY
jgi:hypothetical protein